MYNDQTFYKKNLSKDQNIKMWSSWLLQDSIMDDAHGNIQLLRLPYGAVDQETQTHPQYGTDSILGSPQ